MILDELLEFADATAMNTGAAGSYLIGDVIDLSVIGRDIGNGQPVYCVITIDTLPVSATGTAEFKIVSDAQAAIATDGSATLHASFGAKLAAAMTAGSKFVIALPQELPTYERYLGIIQTTAVAAFSAGKINAFLTLDPTGWKPYADASN